MQAAAVLEQPQPIAEREQREQKEVLSPVELLENFAEFLKLDVANGDARPDTIRGYKASIKQFVEWCFDEGVSPAQATRQDIKAYRQELIDRGYKHATMAYKLTIVRRFYEAAADRGMIPENPAKGVRPPRDREARNGGPKHLTKGELELLFRELEKAEGVKGLRDRAIIYLMAIQGLRCVEIHRMSIEDIDGDQLLVKGKGHNDYSRLGSGVREALEQYLEARGEVQPDKEGTPVFVGMGNREGGNRISRNGIRTVVNSYLKAAGIKRPGISCHALRHSCGTLLYDKFKDLQIVKEHLRHKSIEMASRYAHVVESEEVNFADEVAAAI